jgi:hydrogenase expression/formation protein HypC
MCLGIPSRVVSLEKNLLGMTIGQVEASGTVRRARMDYVPEVAIGDYVMMQMGFAVSVISEQEAGDVLDALGQMVDLSSLDRDSLPSGSGAFTQPVSPPTS